MKPYKAVILLFSCFGLLGCPYRKTYEFQGNDFVTNEIKTLPKEVFYNKHKHGFQGSFVLLLTNNSTTEKRLNFSKSYFFDSKDTFHITNVIFEIGHLLNSETDLSIRGNSSSSIALHFESKLSYPKTDIQLFLPLSDSQNVVIPYKRVRD